MRGSKVLVLGAGASAPYGFPVGSVLRSKILKDEPDFQKHKVLDRLRHNEFVDVFQRSEMYSIDAFLSCRPDMVDLGKYRIAEILLEFERRSTLTGDWYQYLWNALRTPKFEDLDLTKLKIITFNYDRSLERYLLNTISVTYSACESASIEKLKSLEIIHVYGSLGPLWTTSPQPISTGVDVISYGDTRPCKASADNILVIPDERAEKSREFERAREILSDAERICFLGFGFDETNLKRLDSRMTCSAQTPGVPNDYIWANRKVFASCYGLYPSECQSAFLSTAQFSPASQPFKQDNHEFIPHGFHVGRCYETLRHTGFLNWSWPSRNY